MKNISSTHQVKDPPWHLVENKIQKEIDWLHESIETFFSKKNEPIKCPECLIRKIAILIVSGQIKAREIRKKPSTKTLWESKKGVNIKNKKNWIKISHGKNQHKEMMEKIADYFLSYGYEVNLEPNIYWGRADLGVYKKGEPNLLIEVGTTSLFKLWTNLEIMKNCTYLIVLNDDRLIEFVCSNRKKITNRFLSFGFES